MPKLSLDEIKDWSQFEELVTAYFRSLKNSSGTNILDVKVIPSGIGQDGGIDILVNFLVSDSLTQFNRTWVIQCKFHTEAVSPAHVAGIDLPTLVYSYNACGYLLVCKSRPTTSLTDLFNRLNAQNKYHYKIWTGQDLIGQLISADPLIHQQYFPEYADALKAKNGKPKK